MSIPDKMRALVTQSKGVAAVVEVPVPTLEPQQVLVKVEYVSLNPTDWKHLADYSPSGAILGNDFCGKVVALGSGVQGLLKEGDRVAGFVHGGKFPDRGTFAEYIKIDENRAFKVPANMKSEAACQLGVAWGTAAMCLFHHQGNPYPPKSTGNGEWFLVQGGSTSVGSYAIQLAKLAGYRVAATCSPHSNDLVRSYGADEVFDYKAADVVDQIKRATGGGVVSGIECAGGIKSYELAVQAFNDKGGLLTALLLIPDEAKKIRPDVKIERILLYTIGGYSFEFTAGVTLPAKPEDSAWFLDFVPKGEAILADYHIKSNPVDLRHSLDKIPEGLEELKSGAVSGRKLTYRID